MFQRIQTIYLFLAVIVSVVLFCEPAAGGGIREAIDTCAAGGIFTVAGLLLFCFALTAIGGGLLPLIAIFSYHHRLRQIRLCHTSMWLLVPAAVGFAVGMRDYLDAAIPLLALIFIWLAARAVRRDERLVRDADRIR